MTPKKRKKKWHHYAFVYKKGKVWVYCDGKKIEMTIDFWRKE